MATWSLCTKFGGGEKNKQKVFINLDNVVAVERLGDRTSIGLNYNTLGLCHLELAEPEKAARSFRALLSALRAEGRV